MIAPDCIMRNMRAVTYPSNRSPAIHRCCSACIRAANKVLQKTPLDEYGAALAACAAYADAMPSLSSPENVCDYIACIAHGMQLGIFDPAEGSKFLYAAQVALSAFQRIPKRRRMNKIDSNTHTPSPLPPDCTDHGAEVTESIDE